jgi:L-alanine-DL-glutamate epimerase-like enolase superfamily enzyme
VRANTYYQSLIVHNNAGPLGTAASPHASNASLAAIPNVTLLEAPWANHDGETDVCWPFPEIVDGYALPLEEPGLGIEADEASVDEELAASKPFVPSLPGPRLRGQLNALDGSVRDF